MREHYTFRLSGSSLESLKNKVIEIIGYNPLSLPANKFNDTNHTYLQVRALYKLMLYVHQFVMFPRQNDPDLGQYITEEDKEVLPLVWSIPEIQKSRSGNCGTYSFLFEALVNILGYNVRHIIIKHLDKNQGHHVSEVLVGNKWIFFDPMYLVCPTTTKEGVVSYYSAYELIQNPELYINEIPGILWVRGVSKDYWKELLTHLIIKDVKSWEIGFEKFLKQFYGV